MGLRRKNKIVLASASPRRRELLGQHYLLKIIPANCDERQRPSESPSRYVRRIAIEKWTKVTTILKKSEVVVSADTIVVLNGKILGKPKNQDDAKKMIQSLSGRSHRVLTCVAVGWSKKSAPKLVMTNTLVGFRKISKEEFNLYLRSGDWKGKAGAYGIQGEALKFTSKISGSLTGVVGLPLEETLALIEQTFAHDPS